MENLIILQLKKNNLYNKMIATQNKTQIHKYKAIPIIINGFKYYDKLLYYKMIKIDNHFHNIYRNYQRYIEIRKKDIEYKDLIREIDRRDQEKKKLLKRIRNEINFMEKYLMKKEYEKKVLFNVVNENISYYTVVHYDGEYDVFYKFKTTISKTFYSNGLEQEEIENKIIEIIKKFEGYFNEKIF